MCENFFVLAMDIGGNVKYSLVYSNNENSRMLLSGQKMAKTLNEAFWDIRLDIEEVVGHLQNLKYVLLSFPGAISYQFSTALQALNETIRLIMKTFKPFSKDLHILIMGRDGKFYNSDFVLKYCNEYVDGCFFFDSYWRGVIDMAMDIFNIYSFLYLDMGSFSFTIIPVKNGTIELGRHENRVLSERLLTIGLKNTPILYILNELNINRTSFKPYAYVPLYTGDFLTTQESPVNDDSLYDKISRFLGYPYLNKSMAYEATFKIKSAIIDLIRKKVEKHIKSNYEDSDVALIMAGDGKYLLYEILEYENKYILPFDNTHTSMGMAYVFLKTRYRRNLKWGKTLQTER